MKSEGMSSTDRAWLRMDSSVNPMVICGFFLFEEAPDFERLQAMARERILRFDRFRQRLVPSKRPLGLPRWEEDLAFDLDAHLRRVRLDVPVDDAALRSFIDTRIGIPFPPNRPLWRAWLIEGTGKQAALLVQIHHCLADGMALMRVLLSMTDEVSEPRKAPAPAAEPRPAASRSAADWVRDGLTWARRPGAVRGAASLAGKAALSLGRLVLLPPEPPTALRGPLSTSKRVAWSRPLPLDEVKRAGRAAGATINDVLVSAFCGGMRAYLDDRGNSLSNRGVRVLAPVDLRREGDLEKLGNRFGLVFLALPLTITDPAERLAELKRRMDAIKVTPEAYVTIGALGAIGLLPEVGQHLAIDFFSSKGSVVFTNLQGPKQARYLAGVRIKDIVYWVPQSGRISLGVSIISYEGRIRVGVVSDARLVPEPERVVECFERELEALVAPTRVEGPRTPKEPVAPARATGSGSLRAAGP